LKSKRPEGKELLQAKRSGILAIQDKLATLSHDRPYIQHARQLKRAKKK
jgi:hypothetical protein